MSLRSSSSKSSLVSRDGTVRSTRSTSTKASSVTDPVSVSPAARKRRANAVRGTWADQPLSLMDSPMRTDESTHPALHVANDLTHQTNAALRGLNAIYLQAPHVEIPPDITDLLFLMQCWGLWVQYYHELRRDMIFPQFEEALKMPGCISSHLRSELDISPSLTRLLQYVQTTHPMPETFNPPLFQELIMEVGIIFQTHMTTVIAVLKDLPRICIESGSTRTAVGVARISQIYKARNREASAAMDPNIVLPMLMRMRDTTYDGGNNWPGLPLVAVHAIADRLSKVHAPAWRFLPCNVWGKPKELPFLGQNSDSGSSGKGKGVYPPVMRELPSYGQSTDKRKAAFPPIITELPPLGLSGDKRKAAFPTIMEVPSPIQSVNKANGVIPPIVTDLPFDDQNTDKEKGVLSPVITPPSPPPEIPPKSPERMREPFMAKSPPAQIPVSFFDTA